MKKLLLLFIVGFLFMKFSPVIMLFIMYIGLYLLADYDPTLKAKMNEHQAKMIEMFEGYMDNVFSHFSFPTLLLYMFYLLCIIVAFIGVKMIIREVKSNGRKPKEA